MAYMLRFAHSWVLYALIPIIIVCAIIRWRWYKEVIYSYSLGSTLKAHFGAYAHPYKIVLFFERLCVLIILALLIAKPQLVDVQSKINVDGIDIMLAIDASGSMDFRDFDDSGRSRFDVAQAEAIRFIEKRDNDAIGLVFFGKDAMTRSPITLDKNMIKDIIRETKLGDIDPDGTMLATALITAINRLKHNKTKSKIIILLTDGEPSEGDLDPATAIDIAKKMGIKIYTIGIGSETQEVFMDPQYGLVVKRPVNKALLHTIAQETGGQFFMAHNAHDMRAIYDTIDTLEKTEREATIFSKYYDIFIPFIVVVLAVFCLEVIVASTVWFGI